MHDTRLECISSFNKLKQYEGRGHPLITNLPDPRHPPQGRNPTDYRFYGLIGSINGIGVYWGTVPPLPKQFMNLISLYYNYIR